MARRPFLHTPLTPSPISSHRDGNNVAKRAQTPRPLEVNRGHTTFHESHPLGGGADGFAGRTVPGATRTDAPDYMYNRDDDI